MSRSFDSLSAPFSMSGMFVYTLDVLAGFRRLNVTSTPYLAPQHGKSHLRHHQGFFDAFEASGKSLAPGFGSLRSISLCTNHLACHF
ncbi:hypothetical protein SCLCIDRAFT_1220166 [Scleroderma citrinum Foug A]|uniref:Uncharacterized protein n=1 Tax=Scleroderma citrinum Foug A TaxID=1036808 RepID=A0A0C3DKY0_9AGAM|nr:hypothetical protein SCLCIDRAFT_1220166 [Scleroderma citrinum Foug A]